ncbi:MAG: 1,4-dihydroxy-2-naphthoyl-CoA synthase [Fimbriimonadaceae bacterium]|nr:1,4-dihydroxy-2-naphthoyl-CoA synthase [Fimbriimonadaceae bacterium]
MSSGGILSAMLEVLSKGPVLHMVLNRPEVRNALNEELIAALNGAFSNLPQGTRVVVIRGEGKSFCAGGDLNWMRKAASYTEDENRRDAMEIGKLFANVANCPAAVIAQVHGAAFGGGAGLVSAADLSVAAEGTLFSFSEARLGLIPATISGFVIDKIGAGQARALFATAEAFDARRAYEIGLVHACVPEPELEEVVRTKVASILKNGPQAVAKSKRLVLDAPLPLGECVNRLAEARASEEGREGVAAFLEKRPAAFVAEP